MAKVNLQMTHLYLEHLFFKICFSCGSPPIDSTVLVLKSLGFKEHTEFIQLLPKVSFPSLILY